MKKIYICLIWFFIFLQFVSAHQVPVFIYFGSHNETTDQQYHGLDYSDSADYVTMKSYVQAVADTIIFYNAKWDMMLESNFILGCLKNDYAHTNPNNLIEWADNTSQIEVQAHNHFKPTGIGANPYNYPDLCHLLDSCGIAATPQVLGGFIWRDFTNPPVNEDWTQWQTTQPGYTFPTYMWKPTLIWGGGSPNHIDDYDAFGIWRPQAATVPQFGIHDAAQTIINFGSGCGNDFVLMDTTNATLLAYRIMNFADSVNAHFASTPNAFFNLKIMTNFRHYPSAGYVAKIGEIIRIIQPYLNNGKLQWKSIMEQYAWWQQNHPDIADYFVSTCDNTVTLSNATPAIFTGISDLEFAISDFNVSPNPFCQSTVISWQSSENKNVVMKVFDVLGREVFSKQIQPTLNNFKLQTSNWSPGIYFIKIVNAVKKIVKQ